MRPIRLYRYKPSGDAHRAQLFLSLLSLPFAMTDIDLRRGENRSPAYLAMNPFGQVPVIDDNGVVVYDSNAILAYLARTYGGERWMPSDIICEVEVQQWFSLAARLATVFDAAFDHQRAKDIAHQLFAVLEPRFATRAFALGRHATVADVAAYTYIALAPEGDIGLGPYPSLRAWLKRVEALPGFVPMERTAPALLSA